MVKLHNLCNKTQIGKILESKVYIQAFILYVFGKGKAVAQRHHEVSGSLVLLLYCKVLESSRAVPPIGTEVLQNGVKFYLSFHLSI